TFRDALAVVERLADLDPRNPQRQQDVAFSHEQIGDVLVELNDREGALQAYSLSLAFAERVLKAAPYNLDRFRDVIGLHLRMFECDPASTHHLIVAREFARDLARHTQITASDKELLDTIERRLAAVERAPARKRAGKSPSSKAARPRR